MWAILIRVAVAENAEAEGRRCHNFQEEEMPLDQELDLPVIIGLWLKYYKRLNQLQLNRVLLKFVG